jgi:acetoin:2,6-dichlorophenolindophenol oxidoreductase subunit beta
MVIRTPIVSRMGMASQHSQSLEAWFMHVPGLKVAIPSNGYDAKGLLKAALRDWNPILFIENVKLYASKCAVPEEEYLVPLGKARVVRTGKDLTIVAISGMVPEALAATDQLAQEGISAELIDPRTLNPFDMATIADSVRKTGRVLITHDAYRTGGVAAEIGQRIVEEAFDYLNAPILRVTGLDVPVPPGGLQGAVVPNRQKIVEAAHGMFGKQPARLA